MQMPHTGHTAPLHLQAGRGDRSELAPDTHAAPPAPLLTGQGQGGCRALLRVWHHFRTQHPLHRHEHSVSWARTDPQPPLNPQPPETSPALTKPPLNHLTPRDPDHPKTLPDPHGCPPDLRDHPQPSPPWTPHVSPCLYLYHPSKNPNLTLPPPETLPQTPEIPPAPLGPPNPQWNPTEPPRPLEK